jgi:pilus assembly protein CpaB
MTTKKIWLWSLVLGMMVALFVYITLLPQKPAFTASGTEKAKNETVVKAAEEEKEGAPIPNREFNNPIVEIPEGKRAVSITVDLVPGVSGYVEPESKVDVITYETTKDEKTKKKYKSAVLILENIRVLASGKSVDTDAEALQYQSVTLEVTPEQGVVVGLAAKDKDGFYLLLRNSEDEGTGKQGYKETREIIKEDGEGDE